MNYPLENLTDQEFENLVALICKEILGNFSFVFILLKQQLNKT